jgi:hypothetical protein
LKIWRNTFDDFLYIVFFDAFYFCGAIY